MDPGFIIAVTQGMTYKEGHRQFVRPVGAGLLHSAAPLVQVIFKFYNYAGKIILLRSYCYHAGAMTKNSQMVLLC